MGRDKLIRRVARECAIYVEYVWVKLERRGGTSDLPPMNRKAKGESNPPLGEKALQIVEENRTASGYLRFHLDYFESSSRKAENGTFFSEVLKRIRYDAGNLTNWREQKTEEDKAMLETFFEVCDSVAKGVLFVHGEKHIREVLDAEPDDPKRFRVVVNPKDEQLQANQWQTAHNRDNNEKKTYDARESYKRIYPRWLAFKATQLEATLKAAKGLFCKWYGQEFKKEMSVRTLERAIAYCERGEYDTDLKFSLDDQRARRSA